METTQLSSSSQINMKELLISFRSFELLYITDYKVTFQNQSNFLNGSKYVACSCSLLIELLNNIRVQFHPDFQLLVTSLTQLDGRFALDWLLHGVRYLCHRLLHTSSSPGYLDFCRFWHNSICYRWSQAFYFVDSKFFSDPSNREKETFKKCSNSIRKVQLKWPKFALLNRVAKVVRRHDGPSPKSLGSDENLKP